MKVGPRAYSEEARARLLDAWVGEPKFGDAIGCLATSFTFDATFFEEHLLARFLRIESDPAEDIHGYVIEREEKLSGGFAFAMVDQAHVRAERSLRWHLLPMRVPGGGIFHPKVAVLAWQKCIRVLVSSANLTEPGYRRNFEQMAVLDFLPSGDLPLTLLTDVIGFVDAVRRFAPGSDTSDGPKPALNLFLRSIESHIAGWDKGSWARGEPRCHFAGIRPGQQNLFQQLATLWGGPPADQAWVLSPFYSDGGDLKKTLAGLDDVMLKRGPRSTVFLGTGRKTPDGRFELDMPQALSVKRADSHTHRFAFVPERDADSEGKDVRSLHAKSIWLVREDRALVTVDSSNFTGAGTGTGAHVNVEANIVYDLPDQHARFGKIADRAFPPYEEVDPEKAVFLHGEDQTPDPEAYAPLPDAFGSATFRASSTGYSVEFEILGEPPRGFSVWTAAQQTFTDETAWHSQGSPERFRLAWDEPRPPTAFLVRWSEDTEARQALWIVNVGSPADLPPPDELRNLRLDELLEILTSAKPYHEIVGEILRRREKAAAAVAAGIASAIEVDPHKRVDTRNFLLKRMKRIALALEGLKERLERPVFSIEALRWRLDGPFGPVTLARRLAKEEGAGAAFMIAEVALTVNDAVIPAEGALGTVDIPREKVKVLDDLKRLASDHPAPANLASYVDDTFKEILR